MTNVHKVAQQFKPVGAPTIRERLRFALIPLCGVSGSNQEIRELTSQLAQAAHPQAKEEALNRLIVSVEYRLQGSGLTQKQIGAILKAHLSASSVKDSQGFSSSALIDQRYRMTFLDRHAGKIACGAVALTTAAALYVLYPTTQLVSKQSTPVALETGILENAALLGATGMVVVFDSPKTFGKMTFQQKCFFVPVATVCLFVISKKTLLPLIDQALPAEIYYPVLKVSLKK